MTWQPGRDKISALLEAGELEQVAGGDEVAQRLLEDAARHLATAAVAVSGEDLSGAYQLAYDAFRKSAASLLAAQGLRATSRGGHIAIQDAIAAQFGASVTVFRSFRRIRRARNAFEYPSAETPGPSADDADDAITLAEHAREAAATILDQNLLTPW
jgi:HEPN domain-containing protein